MRKEIYNIEAGLVDNDPEGYARLATLMGCAPETTIFRRFGSLSTLILLRKQAKIHELEITLNQYRQEDRKSGHRDRARYDRNFELLERSGDEDAIEEGNNGAQLDILEEIEEKLKDYEEALLRHRELLNLGHASPRQVKSLDTWMQRPRLGNISLLGSDKNIWTDKDLLDDLVALAAKTEEESFTNRFTLWVTHVYNRFIGRYIHQAEAEDSIFRNTIRYTNTGTFRVFKTLSAISASLLPVVGIVVLYFINSIEGRIGAIAGFTFLFSLSLSIITSATVKDIFVAAATFSAVLVVFIGATEQSCRAATAEPVSEISSRR